MADPLAVRCHARLGTLAFGIDFTASAPWTVLFGPSASGKSSVLRLIAGLWQPAGEEVRLGSEDVSHVPPHRRRIGLVAQQSALFPHLSVIENVRFGAQGESERVAEMLELFDLHAFQQTSIRRLSGGERQRVSIARALAADPRVLLLDEVFTGMHRSLRETLLTKVQAHCARHTIMVLSVTHDVSEATACADEVLRLEAGHIVARGKPLDVLAPEREALLRELGLPMPESSANRR